MRILFVDNLLFDGDPSCPVFDLQPHLGLLSLVAVARSAGHQADIFDPKLAVVGGALPWSASLYEDASRLILETAPDVIGFTALGCNFHCVVQIAIAVHLQRPSVPLLLGGPHASILHREILERLPCFTAVARHETEQTLLPLLDALGTDRLAAVPGVTWRRADGGIVCNLGTPKVEELDTLPIPAFDDDMLKGRDLSSIRVEAGRGCPFSCTFCSTASFFGRSYRLKSPQRLVSEMDLLAQRHGFAEFKLNHDLFTVSRRKVLDFCAAAAPRGFRWACSARVDCVDAELLEKMAAAGCRGIYFGIETGSATIQETSRKRLDLTLVEPVLAITERLGIATTTSFIIGYPDETAIDRAMTLDMAGKLHRRASNQSQVHLLTPEPGTAMLERHRAGLRFDGRRSGFNLPRFLPDDDALIAAEPDLFVTHYHYSGLVPHVQNVVATALWRQLAVLGKAAYAFLLDHWDGRLSRLLDAVIDWWPGVAVPDAVPSADALVDFAYAVFGPSAPIVSLLRYGNASRIGPAAGRPLSASSMVGSQLRLAPGVSVLRDIHDVAVLGESILATSNSRYTNLLVLRARENAPARAYEIDAITADVLTLLDGQKDEVLLGHVDAAAFAQLEALGIVEQGVAD
jgi:radical SAM superfamily enzyme YgiQ (UPF0313 family)